LETKGHRSHIFCQKFKSRKRKVILLVSSHKGNWINAAREPGHQILYCIFKPNAPVMTVIEDSLVKEGLNKE
jgi:hypothetical protein